MSQYLTVRESADRYNLTVGAIWYAISRDRLPAYSLDEKTVIKLEDLENYRKNRWNRTYTQRKKGAPVIDNEKGMFYIKQAAEILNIPRINLYYAIRKKYLKSYRKSKTFYVRIEDLHDYAKNYLKRVA